MVFGSKGCYQEIQSVKIWVWCQCLVPAFMDCWLKNRETSDPFKGNFLWRALRKSRIKAGWLWQLPAEVAMMDDEVPSTRIFHLLIELETWRVDRRGVLERRRSLRRQWWITRKLAWTRRCSCTSQTSLWLNWLSSREAHRDAWRAWSSRHIGILCYSVWKTLSESVCKDVPTYLCALSRDDDGQESS